MKKIICEGHSVNKLQNGNIQNILFVKNLILSTCCKFYYDKFTVMTYMNIQCNGIAVVNIPLGMSFFSLGNSILLFFWWTE